MSWLVIRRVLPAVIALLLAGALAEAQMPVGNCPASLNGTAPDQDQDGQSDQCDLDDGWICIEVADSQTIRYQLDTVYTSYNVYRGEVGLMADSGIYSQDVTTVPVARHWCDVTTGTLTDTDDPPLGGIVFYLATGSDAEGESLPGHDSQGHARPHHHPCRPCDTNDDCSANRFCSKAAGNCGGHGVCLKPPTACPENFNPVCGCDGVTYVNACHAAAAEVNVQHAGACAATCTTNAECASTEFCEKAVGNCGGQGQCHARPQVCPDNVDPVCGCDGVTYFNACEAAAAGVSVRHTGECPAACTTNAECASTDYCAKKSGDCGGQGQCQPRPQVCPDVWLPVCGCDGVTYGNACEAAAAGANVQHAGECEATCTANAECASTEYCAKTPGDCAGTGHCTLRGDVCPQDIDPVCGCDGVTYTNACFAAQAGVNVRHAGACVTACTTNTECASTEYCAKALNDCAGTGHCANRPVVCTTEVDPVCGCDGVTYTNACRAAAAGVSVRHAGACTAACTTNAECLAAEYCVKFGGDCEGLGECRPRPQGGCTTLWMPVCGCDGMTYGNGCEAAIAGVSVKHPDECAP